MTPTGGKLGAFSVNALIGALLLISFSAVAATQKDASNKRVKPDPSAEFFADRNVRLFELELTDEAQNALRRSPRTFVVGNVREGTHVLTNVAIHLKGMGSFRRLDEKPS